MLTQSLRVLLLLMKLSKHYFLFEGWKVRMRIAVMYYMDHP